MPPAGAEADGQDHDLDAGQQRYVHLLRSRTRSADAAALLRFGGIQALWIVVIIAGAAVPLSAALAAPTWVGPTLGFVVVVAAGIERVFARATPAAAAKEALRRGLAREHRLFEARADIYAGNDAFGNYTQRCEHLIAEYDRLMVEHSTSMVRQEE